jgi:type II secretory pathway pseudopilin PulG
MSSRTAGASERGITLLEMTVVLGIMMILMGMGVTLLHRSNQGRGLGASTLQTLSVLRFARTLSQTTKSPTVVYVDPTTQPPKIELLERQTVGLWHMEELATDTSGVTAGAFGIDGEVVGAQPGRGRVGNCYKFTGADTITMPSLPFTDDRAGVYISMWLQPLSMQDQFILRYGNDFLVGITSTNTIGVQFGDILLETVYELPMASWTFLEISYDNVYVDVRADGRLIGMALTHDAPIPFGKGPLILGDGQTGFVGFIDEVHLAQMVARQSYELSGDIALETGGIQKLVFFEDGSLGAAFDYDPQRNPPWRGLGRPGTVDWTLRAGNDWRTLRVHDSGLIHLIRPPDNFGAPAGSGPKPPGEAGE